MFPFRLSNLALSLQATPLIQLEDVSEFSIILDPEVPLLSTHHQAETAITSPRSNDICGLLVSHTTGLYSGQPYQGRYRIFAELDVRGC